MSPLALALVWLVSGAAARCVLPVLRRRRLAWLAPLPPFAAVLFTTVARPWPGPAAGHSFGGALALGRPAVGLLAAAAASLTMALALAPRLDGGEVLTAGVVGSACVVALGATVPLIWGLAVAVAASAIALRWLSAAPGRSTLSGARILGVGAALLLAAAAFLPAAGPAVDTHTALAGGLLAGGVCSLLALVPLGGWAPAAAARLAGIDLYPWALLLAPAVLLSSGAVIPALPSGSRTPLANVLLVLGLVSAVFGAAQAARATPGGRYPRVLIADLALAAAGLGSTHDSGRLGGYVLVLSHLCAGPLLIHAPRPGVHRPRALAWLALSGLPPSASFWGRLLVMEGLAAATAGALVAGLAASALALVAVIRALSSGVEPAAGPAAGRTTRALTWLVAMAVLGYGLAPGAITRGVLGAG